MPKQVQLYAQNVNLKIEMPSVVDTGFLQTQETLAGLSCRAFAAVAAATVLATRTKMVRVGDAASPYPKTTPCAPPSAVDALVDTSTMVGP